MGTTTFIDSFKVAAAPFSPPQSASLKLWLKADAITGLADADPVSTWADSSGVGNDVTAAGAARPTWRTNALNGQPIVRFDGSDDLMTRGAPVITVTDNYTIIAVIDPNATTVGRWVVGVGSGNTNGYAIAAGAAPTSPTRVGWARGGFDWPETTTVLNLAPHVFILERATGVSTMYLDGATLSPTSGSAPSAPTAQTRIGSHQAGSNFNGDIAEVFIYQAALSAGERDTIETYLGAKYGITVV